MKYKSVFIATGLAIVALMIAGAKADDTDDLLAQLAASSKTDNAKSDNTDGSTEKLIKILLAYYRAYMQQLNSVANGTDSTPVNTAGQNAAAPADEAKTAAPAAASQGASLQDVHVQPSGPLNGAHLAGYPALPDVDPTSSVTNPTAEQLEQKAETDREQARIKRLLFERWDNPQN